jgi:hypothetical protein
MSGGHTEWPFTLAFFLAPFSALLVRQIVSPVPCFTGIFTGNICGFYDIWETANWETWWTARRLGELRDQTNWVAQAKLCWLFN